MKILVIEDEKMLADSIKSMLEQKGFQVDCVYDGGLLGYQHSAVPLGNQAGGESLGAAAAICG